MWKPAPHNILDSIGIIQARGLSSSHQSPSDYFECKTPWILLDFTCVDYFSVSPAHLAYTCGVPSYYVLTAVWINRQLRLTNHKGTELLTPPSLFSFSFQLMYQPVCAYIRILIVSTNLTIELINIDIWNLSESLVIHFLTFSIYS